MCKTELKSTKRLFRFFYLVAWAGAWVGIKYMQYT